MCVQNIKKYFVAISKLQQTQEIYQFLENIFSNNKPRVKLFHIKNLVA